MSNQISYAFPSENDADKQYNYIHKGITVEDYFAAKALQGLLSNPVSCDEIRHNSNFGKGQVERITSVAYYYARQMMREKQR